MDQFRINQKQILIDKYLPHNFLAEKMILSCLLTNSEAIELTLNTISIEVFYFKNHQEIYRAIISIYKNELPVDILTINEFLQENGLLQKVGGIQVLLEIVNYRPSLGYLKEYIRLVKDKFLRRSLIKLGYEIINSSYATNISLEEILNNLETEIYDLSDQIKTQKIDSSAELLNNIFSELKDKFLNPTLPGILSGFYNLDLLTQGFQKSDLIIIAGRPSMGKTALSLNITSHIIKDLKLPVLFFSLEMSKEQIMYRLLSIETGINQSILKSGKLSQNEWAKLNNVTKILSRLPLFIDDTHNLSVQDIRAKIKKIIFEQAKIGLVIIDYLQLMQNLENEKNNRVQELSQITRYLKNIAREFNIPIVVLSQLSRNVENRLDQKPILSDLRESGSIEQDSDLVLMLSKSKLDDSNELSSSLIELIIAKHRNGPTGSINLQFNKKHMKFLDFDKPYCPEPDSNW